MENESVMAKGYLEKIGLPDSFLTHTVNGEKRKIEEPINNHEEGIKLVLKQLKDVLAYNGVKEIETVGKEFDPELHEAVSHVTDEKLGKNIIKEEFRKGYIIGTKVIRHSMVIVAN